MRISVIISTYNKPSWLEKVLWGYEEQQGSEFDLVIADDGSGEETRELIERFQRDSQLSIQHVWHPDDGFQKSRILNKATLAASGDYLIFTDGDCIPRPDFVSTHARLASPTSFLSGGYCKLPLELSLQIEQSHIRSGEAFDLKWLRVNGVSGLSNKFKLNLNHPWNRVTDALTPTKATWNGCNASTYKKHILAVNGHNEDLHSGGQDREMGERLKNLGLEATQIRNRAILVHLDHSRDYKTAESIETNKSAREKTNRTGATWTAEGIVKSAVRLSSAH